MDAWVLLTLAGSGLAIGFLSGLVGIGGGVLIVPLLYFLYGNPAWSGVGVAPDLEAVVAHATSLFVIVPTAGLGVWTYHREGAVAWKSVLPLAIFSVIGALVASQAAPRLPVPLLKLGFGLLLLFSGLRMLRRRGVLRPVPAARRPATLAVGGLVIGTLAALLGVGGGIIAIPILIYVVGLRLEQVAATSMGIMVFTAAAAVFGYVVGGVGVSGLPPGSIGYVHVLAALPILVGSLVSVPLGARTNQRLDTRMLQKLFGLLFLGLGVWLVVENLLNLRGPGL